MFRIFHFCLFFSTLDEYSQQFRTLVMYTIFRNAYSILLYPLILFNSLVLFLCLIIFSPRTRKWPFIRYVRNSSHIKPNVQTPPFAWFLRLDLRGSGLPVLLRAILLRFMHLLGKISKSNVISALPFTSTIKKYIFLKICIRVRFSAFA